MRRCVIVGFLEAVATSGVATGTSAPLGDDFGSSGMGGWRKFVFPSCDCSVDVEFEGDGVGAGRWVSVLVGPLMSRS